MTTEPDSPETRPVPELVAASRTTGPCGDSVGVGLLFRNQRIEEVTVEADGCESTRACARTVAELARGRTFAEAMAISAAQVLGEASRRGSVAPHCALLATSAFYRALGQALLNIPVYPIIPPNAEAP
jgi:nitrogen fixation NifU-like protein